MTDCSHCGFPIAPGSSVRHFGNQVAHFEIECTRLMQACITRLQDANAHQRNINGTLLREAEKANAETAKWRGIIRDISTAYQLELAEDVTPEKAREAILSAITSGWTRHVKVERAMRKVEKARAAREALERELRSRDDFLRSIVPAAKLISELRGKMVHQSAHLRTLEIRDAEQVAEIRALKKALIALGGSDDGA